MASNKEWVELFHAKMKRQPTAQEYAQALAKGFDTTGLELEAHQEVKKFTSEQWVKLYESLTNHKPSAQEFMQAKETDFDSTKIATIIKGAHPNLPAESKATQSIPSHPEKPASPKTKELSQASQLADKVETPETAQVQPALVEAAQANQTVHPAAQPHAVEADQVNTAGPKPEGAGQATEAAEASSAAQPQFSQISQANTTGPAQVGNGQAAQSVASPQKSQGSQASPSVPSGADSQAHRGFLHTGLTMPHFFAGQPQPPQETAGVWQLDFHQKHLTDSLALKSQDRQASRLKTLVLPLISGLLSLVFMGLSLCFSPLVFLSLSVLNAVLALTLLILSRKAQKAWSIVALVLAILAISLSTLSSIIGVNCFFAGLRVTHIKATSTDTNDYIDKQYQFEWTPSQFKDLKPSKLTVSDIVSRHGKASNAQISGEQLVLIYKGLRGGDRERVSLYFNKDAGGKFILSSADAAFAARTIATDENYKSDWTQASYDALTLGNAADGTGGTSWSEIQAQHPKCSHAYWTVNLLSDGKVNYGLSVSYFDLTSDGDHLSKVSLAFKSKDAGQSYYLVSKLNSNDY